MAIWFAVTLGDASWKAHAFSSKPLGRTWIAEPRGESFWF